MVDREFNKSFPFLHCLATVAIAPFIWMLVYVKSVDVPEVLDLYPLYVAVGALLAVPALVLYYCMMVLLSKYTTSLILLRLYSILLLVAGIFITVRLISDEETPLMLSYFIATLSGFFFKVHEVRSRAVLPEQRMRTLFKLSFLPFILALSAVLTSYFRSSFEHLSRSDGGQNAGFNIGFFIPAMLVSGLLAYFLSGHVLLGWREYRHLKLKIFSLLLTLPVVALVVYYIFIAFSYK